MNTKLRAIGPASNGAVMVAADALGAWLIAYASMSRFTVGAVALLHGMAAVAGWRMLLSWHPETFRASRFHSAQGVLLALVFPILGPLGLGLLLSWTLFQRPQPRELRFPGTPFPDLPAHPSALGGPSTGAGAIAAKLRFSHDPEDRVRAVLATGRIDGPAAVALLREALRDPHEDARLLAHALLQEREKQAEGAIQHLKRQIDTAPAELRPTLHLALAQGFWELCYQGLAPGDVEAFALEQARAHLDEAGQASFPSSDVAERHLLRGRILLRQGDASGALAAFEHSQQAGMPAPVIDSYLSEAVFVGRP